MSSFGEYPRETGDPALRHELTGFQTAKVNRTQRSAQDGQGAGGFGNQATTGPRQSTPQEDPWATPQTTSSAGGWGNGPDSEPPF